MTRPGALVHRIDIERMTTANTDGRNNPVVELDRTLYGIPARVDVVDDTEDIENRTRSTTRIEVEIPAEWAGETLGLVAIDRIVWNGAPYQLIGDSAVASDHAGRADHREFVATRIVG